MKNKHGSHHEFTKVEHMMIYYHVRINKTQQHGLPSKLETTQVGLQQSYYQPNKEDKANLPTFRSKETYKTEYTKATKTQTFQTKITWLPHRENSKF